MGDILEVNAGKFPDKIAVKDARGSLTFPELNDRATRLGNALIKMGLKKGDKLSVISYNCTEFVEVYCAVAKAGIVANPINWRLAPKDFEYIINNADSKAIIIGKDFLDTINGIRPKLENIPEGNYIVLGDCSPPGYINYEDMVSSAPNKRIDVRVAGGDPWILLYTSGTTGLPKGVVRSHESYVAFFLINAVDFGFNEKDIGMIVMPICHVNSTFYGFTFLYIGGSMYLHRDKDFNAEEMLSLIEKEKVTFTSLIPTHYALMLNLPDDSRTKYDLSSIRKLLCSSAPVRSETKKGIMKMFSNAELFEAYGSTEAGLVTLLKPEDQYRKLASIGKECVGTDTIKLLDDRGKEVPAGEVGEIYSRGPMMFSEYYKLPEKTEKAFQGEYFSAGDMGRKDEEGYYYIVDRKDNMIISGGEHVYPSEVEEAISKHPKVMDVAVIGVPHEKWGEAVKAVVVLKKDMTATPEEIIQFCADKLAGYKKPKSVDFIKWEEMPRTGTGKIKHRILRERYSRVI